MIGCIVWESIKKSVKNWLNRSSELEMIIVKHYK